MTLGIARVAAGCFDAALDAGQRLAEAVALPATENQFAPLIKRLKAPSAGALIVGIGNHQGSPEEVPPVYSAVRDARRVRDLLVGLPQFDPRRVRVLEDAQASRQAILEAFERLCQDASEDPAIFYFAGNGSMQGPEDRPTLISADGRTAGIFDISLDELAKIAKGRAPNLVALLDAGFRPGPKGQATTDARFVERDLRPIPSTRDVHYAIDEPVERRPLLQSVMPVIGLSTGFFNADTRAISFLGTTAPRLDDSLAALPAADDGPPWLASRLAAGVLAAGVLAAGVTAGVARFLAELSHNHTVEQRVMALFQRTERYPIERATTLLGLLIEKSNDRDPESRVSRAVAFGLLGDLLRAREDLDAATTLWRNDGKSCFEARYHYGRLLVEHQQDAARAVSELKQAVEERPDHPGARYYLCAAIVQMIEQQSQAQLEEHWDRYLKLDAPLGHNEQVSAFLRR